MVIGLWNRNYDGFSSEGNKKKGGLKSKGTCHVLRNTERKGNRNWTFSVFDLNGNTGKLSVQKKTEQLKF